MDINPISAEAVRYRPTGSRTADPQSTGPAQTADGLDPSTDAARVLQLRSRLDGVETRTALEDIDDAEDGAGWGRGLIEGIDFLLGAVSGIYNLVALIIQILMILKDVYMGETHGKDYWLEKGLRVLARSVGVIFPLGGAIGNAIVNATFENSEVLGGADRLLFGPQESPTHRLFNKNDANDDELYKIASGQADAARYRVTGGRPLPNRPLRDDRQAIPARPAYESYTW